MFYCASPPITSQLVLFMWQTVKIDPLGHVRVVEALQNFAQKCNPVTLLGILKGCSALGSNDHPIKTYTYDVLKR